MCPRWFDFQKLHEVWIDFSPFTIWFKSRVSSSICLKVRTKKQGYKNLVIIWFLDRELRQWWTKGGEIYYFSFFCPNPNLPFFKYASFFVQFYSTVCSNPTFFCHKSILPFVQIPRYSVWILFYRSLKPHLFCHNSILPFDPLPFFSVSILFYRSLNHHLFLS